MKRIALIAAAFALFATPFLASAGLFLDAPPGGWVGVAGTDLTMDGYDIVMGDDDLVTFGDAPDYWIHYDLSNTQLCITSTNGNGAGADTCVLSIDDGDDNVDLSGDLVLAGSLVLPAAGAIKPTASGGAMTLTLGDNSDNDPVLSFDADTNDGSITFDEANNQFVISDNLKTATAGGPLVAAAECTGTVPCFRVDDDADTGLGSSAADVATIIGGGAQILDVGNYGTAGTKITSNNSQVTGSADGQYGFIIYRALNDASGGATHDYTLIKGYLTETATGAWEEYVRLLDLQTATGSKFSVDDSGNVVAAGTLGGAYADVTNYVDAGTGTGRGFSFASSTARYGAVVATWNYDDMTDGGGASGTYLFTGGGGQAQIPAGAYVTQAVCHSITGFAGDVSAVITLGDGTDVDRYNTGTPDVFSTVAAGVDMGSPSGTVFHSAEKGVTATITTNADFTSVSAGTITCAVFWVGP